MTYIVHFQNKIILILVLIRSVTNSLTTYKNSSFRLVEMIWGALDTHTKIMNSPSNVFDFEGVGCTVVADDSYRLLQMQSRLRLQNVVITKLCDICSSIRKIIDVILSIN